ncbi:WYL domain-containing protein [Sphaerotilus sp.]|uniref:helix-turn-helix transcriptional regulator n=1 Tax=Sphaerotilus sp. TaxID=2093942 RepID=UPI002ACD3970|nr:WYL domain-containing protein [Sphaerotilus sp.]MDZ7855087.1 WYL domain-containing protein [Sphaerotilus sp.]
MPAQSKPKTLARLLDLLQAIPRRSSVSATELQERLRERGHGVTLRSVQRDLQMLRDHFPLEVNESSKPHSWRWGVEADQGIGGMSVPEALMVTLVKQHLQAALPAHMIDGFATVFEQAGNRLQKLGDHVEMPRWADKVRVVTPGLLQMPPVVNPGIRSVVSNALLKEVQIEVSYARASQSQDATATRSRTERYTLHPLGLVLRGGTTYLIASKGFEAPPGFYAMHRILRARMVSHPIMPPRGWSLDQWLSSGQAQFGMKPGSQPIELVLACSSLMGGMLQESPLDEDQWSESMSDGRVRVQASVADTWELRWWLVGRSAEVEVLAPQALRDEIRHTLRQALAGYEAAPAASGADTTDFSPTSDRLRHMLSQRRPH